MKEAISGYQSLASLGRKKYPIIFSEAKTENGLYEYSGEIIVNTIIISFSFVSQDRSIAIKPGSFHSTIELSSLMKAVSGH